MEKNSLLFFLFISLSSTFIFSQNQTPVFPDDWMGTYQGDMYILNAARNSIDTVDVHFVLAPTEEEKAWKYTMSYKSSKYGNSVKAYRLIKPDTLAANVYLMDENNGIFIEEVLMGNTFYSCFSVGNTRLFSTMRKKESAIEWEIISTRKEDTMESGTEPDENGRAFIVNSFLPISTQKAILKRVKE